MKKAVIILSFISMILLSSCTTKTEEKVSLSQQEGAQDQIQELPVSQETLSEEMPIKSSDTMMKKEGEGTEEETKAMEKDAMMDKGEKMMDTDMKKEDTMMKSGVYTSYSPELVGKTDKTVLFFHASWCPSCRAADSGINADKIPEGLSILKVDYDNSTDLKKKYEVLSQHTFVQVDKNGNMLGKWAGGTKVSDITENLK